MATGKQPKKAASVISEQHETYRLAIKYIGNTLAILASALPLWMLYFCVREVTGKQTNVNLGITLTASVAGIAAVIKAYFSAKKARQQTEELIRLRERCIRLEEKLNVSTLITDQKNKP
jgi:hypothetical protein